MFRGICYGTAIFLQLISWLGETHVKLRLLGVLAVVMLQLLGATSACAQCGEPSELPEAAIASMEAVSVRILLEEEVVTQQLIATEPQPVAFELVENDEVTRQAQYRAAIDINACERYYIREAITELPVADIVPVEATIEPAHTNTAQEQTLVGLTAEPSVLPSARYLPPVSEATDIAYVSVASDLSAENAYAASRREIQRRYEETERMLSQSNAAYREILAAGRRWDEFDKKYGKKTAATANNHMDNNNNTPVPLTASQSPSQSDSADSAPPAPKSTPLPPSSIRIPFWYRMSAILILCAFLGYFLFTLARDRREHHAR